MNLWNDDENEDAGVAVIREEFEAWCEKPWHVLSGWAVPCVVHVSPACLEHARVAYAENPDIHFGICFNIAAGHYDELRAKYRTGQVAHSLTGLLEGTWYVLLYLDMLYLDDQEHPVPTQVRRTPPDSG